MMARVAAIYGVNIGTASLASTVVTTLFKKVTGSKSKAADGSDVDIADDDDDDDDEASATP
jgi:hypothetical protein